MNRLKDDANEQFRVRERADYRWSIPALIGFMIIDFLWLAKWG